MQGSFRRGRRRCDGAGTETWQGKFLIQQCLFSETSDSVFRFCYKVRSWEVSVADQAPALQREGSRWSSQLASEARLEQSSPGQLNSAEPAPSPGWGFLVQFPPGWPSLRPVTQPGELRKTPSAFTWDQSRPLVMLPREPVATTALLLWGHLDTLV